MTTKPAQHTPTPWRAGPGSHDISWSRVDDNCPGITITCRGFATSAHTGDIEFIVRACNSHDALVAACEDAHALLITAAEHCGRCDKAPQEASIPVGRETIETRSLENALFGAAEALRAAIAKARGGAA